ncbi:DUF2752 domain-containing protein [Arcticibacter sp. MXS-1]|uniref:DUF2752 domain-containing protein n=1 Tax=Arcticibacter sp. MXS-1 TaxID=3341726 RepID=UPI0035A83876
MAAAAVVLYYVFNPRLVSFFPRCPFHEMTGWSCPGCGSQRAFHALLHGNLREAVQHNVLFAAGLPLLVLWWALKRSFLSKRLNLPHIPRLGACLTIAIVLLSFSVLRNLPWC